MKEKVAELHQGVKIIIVLAILTGIEFAIGVRELPNVFLWVIAILKAALVVWFFMHIRRVFNLDEGEHR